MLNMQMGKESMQNRKPMILVLAGPNGSGESTITAFFDKVGRYTNADDIVRHDIYKMFKDKCDNFSGWGVYPEVVRWGI